MLGLPDPFPTHQFKEGKDHDLTFSSHGLAVHTLREIKIIEGSGVSACNVLFPSSQGSNLGCNSNKQLIIKPQG